MNSLLRTDNVSFAYGNDKVSGTSFALKNISIGIDTAEFISVVGKNGSGKSTLVKLLSRILTGYKGDIYYSEKKIHSISKKEFSRNICYLPQSPGEFNEELKVKEFLLLGRYAYKSFTDFRFSDNDVEIVERSIAETFSEKLTEKRIGELSGGEKQKVLITLALVQLDITNNLDGKVLIIDEPLTYLDVNHQFEIFGILKKLNERNLTIVIVIHDLNLALRYSDKTMLLHKGSVIKFDKTSVVITEEVLKEYFLIESKIMNFEKNYFINYLPN